MKKVDITEELGGTLLEGRPILARGTVKAAMSVTSLLLTRTDMGPSVLEERDLMLAIQMPDGVVETIPVVRASSIPTGWLVVLGSPLSDTALVGDPWCIAQSNQMIGAVPRAPDEKVLMSAEHPEGWKLEDLVKKLIGEVEAKSARIVGDTRPIAQHVLQNNEKIVGHFKDILGHQLATVQALDGYKADMGPTGKPRIGEGSDPEPTDPVDDLKKHDAAMAHVDGDAAAGKPVMLPSVPLSVRAAQAETEAKDNQGKTNEPIKPLPPVTGPGTAAVENNAGPGSLHGNSLDAFAGQAVTETGEERAAAPRPAPEKPEEKPLAYNPKPAEAAVGAGTEAEPFRGEHHEAPRVDLGPVESLDKGDPDHGMG